MLSMHAQALHIYRLLLRAPPPSAALWGALQLACGVARPDQADQQQGYASCFVSGCAGKPCCSLLWVQNAHGGQCHCQ